MAHTLVGTEFLSLGTPTEVNELGSTPISRITRSGQTHMVTGTVVQSPSHSKVQNSGPVAATSHFLVGTLRTPRARGAE